MPNWLVGLNALAQAGQQQQQQVNPMAGGCLETGIFLLIIVGIFWLMVIRPQRKQQLEQQRFLDRLKEGDRIVTSSGIFGRIVKLEAEVVTLDVGDRTRIRMLRSAVARSQPDGGSAASDSSSDDDASKADSKKKR